MKFAASTAVAFGVATAVASPSITMGRRDSAQLSTLSTSLESLVSLLNTDTRALNSVLNAGWTSGQDSADNVNQAYQIAYSLSAIIDYSALLLTLQSAANTVSKSTLTTSGGLFTSTVGLSKYEAILLGQDVNSLVNAIQGMRSTLEVAMSDLRPAVAAALSSEGTTVVTQLKQSFADIKADINALLTPLDTLLRSVSSATSANVMSVSGLSNAIVNLEAITSRLTIQA